MLAGFAAIRVFVYSAAFPFFNNVDEQAHFDLVVKYSHGQFPRSFDPCSEESAQYLALYGTPEYFFEPESFPEGKFPPPLWTYPPNQLGPELRHRAAEQQGVINHESAQTPLYYGIAGFWLRLGRGCGIRGGFLLYWIRFFNIFLAIALVWMGFWAVREVFPERQFLRLGMPVLLAFYPQDIFYSIQNDVLSPLLFGMAFISLVKWLREDIPGVKWAVPTGLALAGTGLIKATNLPLLAVAGAAVLFKVGRRGRLYAALPALGLFALCVILPLGGWWVRTLGVFGDLTGAAAKLQLQGWTRKPLSDWWPHPIFTPHGLWEFWSELMASFWRGEFTWCGQRLASPVMDAFYWISSVALPAVAIAGLFRRRAVVNDFQRQAVWLAFCSFAAAVAFLALISIAYDFGNCAAPSRAFPFLTAGRYLTGALIPFFLLYLLGLDLALGQASGIRQRLLVLAGIVLLITVSEFKVNRPAFSSAYNWFHLWTGASSPLPAHSSVNPAPTPTVSWRLLPTAEPVPPGFAGCRPTRG